MDNLHPRRYIFRGHASGVSAHIRRPENQLLPVQGCSSLPVIGGFAESKVGPQKLGTWVAFDAVSTSAHGDYVDAAEGVATTTGAVAFDAAPTQTKVQSDVTGLTILGRVHVAHAAAGLISRSPKGQEQPSITLDGNVLDGVSIDDSRLAITLAEDFYRVCNTKDKLAKAAGRERPATRYFPRSQWHGEVHHRQGNPLGWRTAPHGDHSRPRGAGAELRQNLFRRNVHHARFAPPHHGALPVGQRRWRGGGGGGSRRQRWELASGHCR
jgi:hypothetical protein